MLVAQNLEVMEFCEIEIPLFLQIFDSLPVFMKLCVRSKML